MPLVYLAVAWVAGIAIEAVVDLPATLWAFWLILPAGLLLIWWRDAFLRLISFCLLVFILAALRYAAALPHLDEQCRATEQTQVSFPASLFESPSHVLPLACFNDQGVILMEGIVIEPPVPSDKSIGIRLTVSRVRADGAWHDVSGLVLVQAPRETDVRYGDRLQINGEPATPPTAEDFSYKDYLARHGIHSIVRLYGGGVRILARDQGDAFFSFLYSLRARGVTTVYAMLPEPSASLLAGILLGDDSGMPHDLSDAFSATNTAHIIAISGFNISVIAGILSKLAHRVIRKRWIASLVVVAGLIVYTLLVGAGPSVVRATIMGSLSVVAAYYFRQNDALNALALAGFGMTALDPFTLFDLSFQLSFLATLGLILYVEPLTNWFESNLARLLSAERAKQVVGALGDSLIVTIAAQITTTPLIVFAFHRLSLVGLLTNLLILPAQPSVEIWGGLATLAGMVSLPVGQVLAWISWAFLEWTILIVQATASLPFAALDVGRLDTMLIVLYLVFIGGITRTNWRTA